MVVFLQVQLQAMAVFGSIGAVSTAVLVDIGMGLHVRVEHALVDACIVAFGAFEGLRAKVVAEVVFEMVLILSDEWTFWALQDLVFFDMAP